MLKSLRALGAAGLIALCALWAAPAFAQAVQVAPGEVCFQATTGINGMIGLLGTLTGGSGGTTGTYTNVAITGGSGTAATATITVSGGAVTQVSILNPGINYVVGDSLSASSADIGNVSGFSVLVSSISINSSLAGGTVGMYVPGTLTYSQTWQNAGQTINNTNPITLDGNGCAIIYGIGTYRQILYDRLGNEVWDQLTSVAPVTPFWAGTASGTANAITVTDASFSATDGQSIAFIASNTNTGATTLNPSSFGAISIVKNSSSGPVALTGGEIISGGLYTVTYSSSLSEFFLENPTTAVSFPLAQCTVATNIGFVGNGSTDNTAAFNSWTAALPTNGGCLQFPAGDFVFDSALTYSYTTGGEALTIIGAGAGLTFFDFPSASGMAFTGNVSNPAIHLRDFSLITREASTGTGIELSGPSSIPAAMSDLTNVTVSGSDYAQNSGSDYWTTAILDQTWCNLSVDNVNTYGLSGSPGNAGGGAGLQIQGAGGAYAELIYISNSSFNSHVTGILLGSYWQGVFITQSIFNGEVGSAAIEVPGSQSGTLSDLTLTNSQLNYATRELITATAVSSITLTGDEFNVYGNNAIGVQNTTGYFLNVIGNEFASFGGSNQTGIYTDMGTGTIQGNTFYTLSIGADLDTSSNYINLSQNEYNTVGTHYTNNGTDNSVGTATP